MTVKNKLDCIRRLAIVLSGKVEPSVDAVIRTARQVRALAHDPVSGALHKIYDEAVKEPVPDDMLRMLASFGGGPKHFEPPQKPGGNYGEGRRRTYRR